MAVRVTSLSLNSKQIESFSEIVYNENIFRNDDERAQLEELNATNNSLPVIPPTIETFFNLKRIDLSNNGIQRISEALCNIQSLQELVLRNNNLTSDAIPKNLCQLRTLAKLNLSGNKMHDIPPPISRLPNLKFLQLGGNKIGPKIDCPLPSSLEHLYLGGNKITHLGNCLHNLNALTSLVLCNNRLSKLPSYIKHLSSLKSLSLHGNNLQALPSEILQLKALQTLTLRDNPLVKNFVNSPVAWSPPSLQELAAKVIKRKKVHYDESIVPRSLVKYLDAAKHCVNPKCKGVYFNTSVQQIEFVDFCGRYRIPLLRYLCHPKCHQQPAYVSSSESEESDVDDNDHRIRRVLLG